MVLTVKKWPLGALGALNREPTASRLFHEQDWGGLIAAECRPQRRSYLDDRFELFGKEAILEYVDVLSGGPAWDTVRDRDRIEMVWLRPERGLAKRLLQDPGWNVVYRDKVSVLLKKAGFETLARAHEARARPNRARLSERTPILVLPFGLCLGFRPGQILEEIQAALPGAKQIDIPVAVDIHGGHLQSRAGRSGWKVLEREAFFPLWRSVLRGLTLKDHVPDPALRLRVQSGTRR